MLKATLIGNLGNDPEMKYSANGAPFLRFNVASNYRTRTPEGEWQDRTEWVRVTFIGQRAESLGQFLHKGSRVYVDGRLEARPWSDQQGQVRAGLEIVATDVQNLTTRAEDEGRAGGGFGGSGGYDAGTDRPAPRERASSSAPSRPAPRQQSEPVDDGDLEDLPF
ncbi:MAG: single-stranded DNA-binding protein [Chloroflexota bacterium]